MTKLSIGNTLGALALLLAAWMAAGCQLVFGDVDIKDLPPPTTECDAGQHRCNGEYLLSCGRSGWVLEETCATAVRCDPMNERCTVCKDGDFRCNGAAREACEADGSGWRVAEMCASADMCSPAACGPCTPGEHQCAGPESRELRECGPDQVWVTLDICATPSLCETSLDMALANPEWGRTCEQPGCNQPGTYACDGARLLRCPQDRTGWTEVDACATPALCEVGAQMANASDDPNAPATVDMCPEGCPAAGAFVCADMTLRRCSDDLTRWEDVVTCTAGTECNPVQGDCTARCTPGEFQCNGAELRRCGDDREWSVVATCASSALCNASQDMATGTWSGACREPACATGEYSCDGTTLRKCSTDLTAWVAQATCASPALCNALSQRCDPTGCDTAGEYRCFNTGAQQQLRQCRQDLTGWANTAPACSAGQFCDPNSPTSPCKTNCPAATYCNGQDLVRCNRDTGIQSVTCLTGALCQCSLTDTCPAGETGNGCGQAVCTANAYRCTPSGRLERCLASRTGWALVANCGAQDLCLASATEGRCLECPVAGEVRCNETSTELHTCDPDRARWNLTQTCPMGCVSVAGGAADYCATCNPGVSSCAGTTLQTCAADRRTIASTMCMSTALCDAGGGAPGEGECDICAAGTATCGGGELRRCSDDGQMVNPQTCPANLCDASNGGTCNACVPNSAWCTNAVLNLCEANGMTQTMEACASAALCDATAGVCRAPACAAGQANCAGATRQTCNADRTGFRDVEVCASAALCSEMGAGSCMPPACDAGAHRCTSTGMLQTCAPDRTEWVNDTQCVNQALCNATTGTCTEPTCAAGAQRCRGDVLEECSADRTEWTMVRNCGPGLCNATTATCTVAVCGAGERRCRGDVLEECSADRTEWTMVSNCGPGLCDATALACDECAPPDVDCPSNTTIRECDTDGQWGAATPCPGAQMCNQSAGRCVGGMGGTGGEGNTAGTGGVDMGGTGGTAGSEPGGP